jgi:serine/threonine protein kinase
MICNIEKELGSGTQGKVYSLITPDNSNLVLKWYFTSMATVEQYEILKFLTTTQSPSEKFLWPLAIVENSNKPGFGYIMLRKEDRFKSFSLWLSRKIEPTFKVLLTSCFEICQNFHVLHSKGLCYQDLSLNNIYFDPKNGDIRIGDTDNIVVNGSNKGNVIGTPKFMAPEVITGNALPNTQTDLYSLAVLMFYILFLNHPLEGKKETAIKSLDLPSMKHLYGTNPVFIFDPEDKSNYPDPIYHHNAQIFWDIYPQLFKNLFVRSFTEGIRDSLHGRVRETEWKIALSKMLDSIFYCPLCGSENFLEFGKHHGGNNIKAPFIIDDTNTSNYNSLDCKIRTRADIFVVCWNPKCRNSNPKVMFLLIEDKIVVTLNHDTKLYSHHINPNNGYDFNSPIAEVTKHPENENIWGLRNLSQDIWKIYRPKSGTSTVYPQQNLLLSADTEIDFGFSRGKLCY